MLNKYFSALALFVLVFLSACTHDTDLAAINEISYASDIQPILASNCTQSGCHNDQGDSEFSLVTYDDVIENGEVTAGDAHGSELYKVISNRNGEEPMPPSPL